MDECCWVKMEVVKGEFAYTAQNGIQGGQVRVMRVTRNFQFVQGEGFVSIYVFGESLSWSRANALEWCLYRHCVRDRRQPREKRTL